MEMYLIALLTITAILTGQSEAEDCKPDVWMIGGTIGDNVYDLVFRGDYNCVDDYDIISNVPYVCNFTSPSMNITDLMKPGQNSSGAVSISCQHCKNDMLYKLKLYGHVPMGNENWMQLLKSSNECTFDDDNSHTCIIEGIFTIPSELPDYSYIKEFCLWSYLSSDDSTSKPYSTWVSQSQQSI